MNFNLIRPFLAMEEGYTASIKYPWLFLVLIPAIVLAIIPFFRLHKSRRYNAKHIVPLILHIFILAIATMLITQIKIIETSKAPEETKIVIVADVSDSNSAMKDKMNEYIKAIHEDADEFTDLEIMIFAHYDADIRESQFKYQSLDKAGEDGDYLDGSIKAGTGNTHIQKALLEAYEHLKAEKNCNKRVILLSDGRQTVGNALGAAKTYLSEDIRLDAAFFDVTEDEDTAEVQMLSITTAVVEEKNTNVAIKLDLMSTMATSGKIVFYEVPQSVEGEGTATPVEVHSENVSIKKGKNAFSFSYLAEGAGIHTVYAEFIQAEGEENEDAITQNNTIYSWFAIDGKAKILIFDGDGTQAQSKITNLISSEYEYEVMTDYKLFPASMEDLLPYDEIVLMNIDFAKMPYGSTDLIKRYVEELGRGIVFTCGSNTYNYNDQDYADNPLIDILPVDLKIDERKEIIATIITVDMSSSMGQAVETTELNEHGQKLTRYDMVKQSVLKLIERKYDPTTNEETTEFADEDYIGIILFDADASIALPLTQLYERDWIAKQIEYSFESYFYKHTDESNPSYSNRIVNQGTKDANGYQIKSYGTNYKFGIDAANAMLSESDADLKQMVFLSDGEPSDKNAGYDNTIRRMAQAGVVTSTISVGKGNSNELQNLATIGHGKFSQVTSTLDLNNSLVQIAETIKGKPINERPTQLEKQNSSSILVGVKDEYDIIQGYYGTTIKNGAKIVLSADDLRPIIAEWDVGLGHATVYMSDLGGSWSKSLFTDEDKIDNIKIVQNLLVNSVNDDVGASGLKISSDRSDETTKITIETEKRIRDGEELVLYRKDANGDILEYRDFDRLADTKYKTEIETPDAQGNYHIEVQLVDKNTGAICDTIECAVVGFFDDEYDLFGVDGESALEDIASAGGGAKMQDASKFYDIQRKEFVQKTHDLSLPSLIVLIVLFILEIVFRHLPSKKKDKKNVMTEEERFASMRGR